MNTRFVLLVPGLLSLAATAGAQEPLDTERLVGVRADTIAPAPGERAAAGTVTELLRGGAAGVNVQQSSGSLGASPRLWVRGPGSLVLRDRPLVVVDGVRMESEGDALSLSVGGQSVSRLEDLSPDEVESVRVLRGPAAAAAYGAEAAAGVLEIRTRTSAAAARPPDRGPEVHGWSALSLRSDVTEYPVNFSRRGTFFGSLELDRCSLGREAEGLCVPLDAQPVAYAPFREASPFRSGLGLAAGAGIGGALPAGWGGYAFQAGTEESAGVLESNQHRLRHLRGSGRLSPGRGASLWLHAAHSRRHTELPFEGQAGQGRIGTLMLTGPFDTPPPEAPRDERHHRNREEVHRSSLGGGAEWRPLTWLRLRGRGGLDDAISGAETGNTAPAGPYATADAERRRSEWSVDATLLGRAPAGGSGALTAGAERIDRALTWAWRRGTPEHGASARGSESWRSEAGFVRGALGWRTLTLAGTARRERVGGHGQRDSFSAGGEWSAGDASWLARPRWMDGLVFRGAAGRTERGREWTEDFSPPVMCTVRCPSAPAPERVTELEGGADLSLLRAVLVGVTAYRRDTDRLLGLRGTPEFGNVGSLRNRGVELTAAVHGGEEGRLAWRMDVVSAWNRNRIDSPHDWLGSVGYARHSGGYPAGALFGRPFLGWRDHDDDGYVSPCRMDGSGCEVEVGTERVFLGSTVPVRIGAAAGTLRFAPGVRVHARVDWQGGARRLDEGGRLRCAVVLLCEAVHRRGAAMEEQAAVAAYESGSLDAFIHDASFVRLREVSVTLHRLDRVLGRAGAARADLTIAGRNLATRTRFPGLDPETSVSGPELFAALNGFEQPPVRTVTARIDVRL
jgi:hypothetical protein